MDNVKKETTEVLVLVHDPILGSRYELQEVEIENNDEEINTDESHEG
jgi:hypothetical protein